MARCCESRLLWRFLHGAGLVGDERLGDVQAHSGAISLFDREFVKTGVFSKELSFILHSSFDVRQEADYEELASIGECEAREAVTQSREFVSKVSAYLTDQLSDDLRLSSALSAEALAKGESRRSQQGSPASE